MRKLREYRKKAGLTQQQLAEALDVSRPAIARWENEDLYPAAKVIVRIAELLKCDVRFLMPKNVK